jgi:hypothetical protein
MKLIEFKEQTCVIEPITVKILVTVNDPAQFDACTLCFESLRVGWPTADIHVYFNGKESASAVDKLLYYHGECQNIFCHNIDRIHLAEWISREVRMHPSLGTLVIADPDIVYWKSCEDWEFLPDTLLAGYYHPRMWNDFAGCISVQRIHTSMMVFPNTIALWEGVRKAYPLAREPHGEYCPCDPFMGRVMFDNSQPIFWDCCAVLYNMLLSIKGTPIEHFGNSQLSCYDHLNSASFYQVMCERLQGQSREGFIRAHNDWVKRPTPGLWPLVDEYYKQKAIEAWVKQPEDRILKV